jgi:uncharacterized membrane protein
MEDIFKGFPNLHPFFVHFPIVLLLLALLAQCMVLLLKDKKTFKWISFFLIATGCISAYVAMQNGTHLSGDADEKAFAIIDTHYLFARITLWSSLIISFIRLAVIMWYPKRWMEYVLIGLFNITVITVSITAHHGAQLVYIYGVGPQGNGILSK